MDEKDAEAIKKELKNNFKKDLEDLEARLWKEMYERLARLKIGELRKSVDEKNDEIKKLWEIIDKQKEDILKIKGDMKYIQNELKENNNGSLAAAANSDRQGGMTNEKKMQSLETSAGVQSEKASQSAERKYGTEENIRLFNLGKIDSRFIRTKLNYNSGDKVIEDMKADDRTKFFYRVNSSDGYFDIFPVKNLESENLRYLESFFDIDKRNRGKIEVSKVCRIASTSYGYYYFVSRGIITI